MSLDFSKARYVGEYKEDNAAEEAPAIDFSQAKYVGEYKEEEAPRLPDRTPQYDEYGTDITPERKAKRREEIGVDINKGVGPMRADAYRTNYASIANLPDGTQRKIAESNSALAPVAQRVQSDDPLSSQIQTTPEGVSAKAAFRVKNGPVDTPQPELTLGDAYSDMFWQFAVGANNIVGSPFSAVAPDSAPAQYFKRSADMLRNNYSPALQHKELAAKKKIDAAREKDGEWGGFTSSLKEYGTDPALSGMIMFETLPSMLGVIGPMRAAQVYSAARGLSPAAAASLASTTGGISNAVMNGGAARQEAYDTLLDVYTKSGMQPDEAKEAALQDSLLTLTVGAGMGFLGGKFGGEAAVMGLGGAGNAIGRGGLMAATKAGAGAGLREVASEQGEEVLPQVVTNSLASEHDGRSPFDGVGEIAAKTLIGTGPLAGVGAASEAGRAYDSIGTALQYFADAVESTNPAPMPPAMGQDTAETTAARERALAAWNAGIGARRAPDPKTPEQVLTDIINDAPAESSTVAPSLPGEADAPVAPTGDVEAGQLDQQTLLDQIERQVFGNSGEQDGRQDQVSGDSRGDDAAGSGATVDGMPAVPLAGEGTTGTGTAVDVAGAAMGVPGQPGATLTPPAITVTPRKDGTAVVSGEGAQEAVAEIVPKASMVQRADGSVLVGATYAPAVQQAIQSMQTSNQPTATSVLQQTPVSLPIPQEIQRRMAKRTDAELDVIEKTAKDPVTKSAAKKEKQNRVAPIMQRDDLVGAIMRITGGRGIDPGMALTLTGDKANQQPRLRGLFKKGGTADMSDLAELLRIEQGYDVRDGTHLEELIREQAAGNPVYSMERNEREAAENEERQYRDEINKRAVELGLKQARGKRTLEMVEADIARVEQEQNDMEAREERAAIQAESAASEAFVDEGAPMTEDDFRRYYEQAAEIEYTQEDFDRAEEYRTNREDARTAEDAFDAAEREAQSRSGERNQDGQAEEGARGTAESAGQDFQLNTYTESELAAREAAEQARAEAEQAATAKAEKEKQDRQFKQEVKRRSEAAAETFELGQDGMDNLTGQGGLRFSKTAKVVDFLKTTPVLSAPVITDSNAPIGFALRVARPYYESLMADTLFSPAFGEKVSFTEKGWKYITDEAFAASQNSQSGRKNRSAEEVSMRLSLLPKAKAIIEKSEKIEGSRDEGGGVVRYSLVGRFEDGDVVRVIVEETNKDGKVFLSLFDLERVSRQLSRDSLPVTARDSLSSVQGKATGNESASDSNIRPDGSVRKSFAGRQSQTADTHALATAQDRLNAGDDAETVRQETGWFKGNDGKWRYEISDADAQYIGKDEMESAAEADPYKMVEMRLDEVLNHPALFAAYPALRDITVAYEASSAAGGDMYYGANYSAADNTITIGNGLDEAQQLSALLHEIQHGIQNIEGFATGGSADADVTPSAQAMSDAMVLRNRMDRGMDIGEARSWFLNTLGRDASGESTYLAERYTANELAKMPSSPQDRYNRLAGEVEARNTQARQNLTDDQRRATPPSQTADVADADVIVVFNGKEMQSAPAPANAQPSTNAPALTESDLLPLMGKAMGSETLAKVLLDAGIVTGVRRGADFQGATFEDGRIILNLDALTADNFAGVFKHEGFHSTVKTLLGEAKYNQLMKQLQSQVGLAKGNPWVDQANAAVPADTKAAHKTEEIAAYAIEQVTNGAKVPGFIKRWVGELLSALRTAIIRFAKTDSKLQGWAMGNLKPEDLARLAVAGLRAKARGAMQQAQMREAVAYSNAPVGKEIVSSIADMNRILTGKPLALLQTSDAPHLGKAKLREWAVGVFRDYGFYANNKTLGKVLMDERSIRDSIGHSLNPFKAVAFKAVPDVIENGAIVHVERKGDMDSIYISGPVVINGTDDIVTVLVRRDINTQRMYLHSVTTKEGLLRSSQSSADTNVSERSGTVISGGISKILQAALNYNGEDDIRYSRAQPPLPGATQPQPARKPALPADTLARKTQRKIQDKLNRFTVIKEWLADNGVTLSEQADIHKAEERMHSRFANKAQDFREKRVMPLVKKVQKAGFTMEDVAQFLHANHAQARNAQIAKINPGLPDGGSGMTNAEAQAILKAAPAELKALALEFRAITEDSKQILLKAGVIDQDTVNAWEAAYGDTYVPLKGGPDENAAKVGNGKGLSLKHKQKRALGHETRAEGEWIIENILADHERALMAAEKNRVFHNLVKMALETAHLDLITINKPEKRQVLMNRTSYVVRKKGVDVASFQTDREARAFIQHDSAVTGSSRGDYTAEQSSDPSVAMMASPMPGPDEATGYINGHLVRVQFNDPLMAEAYNNMGAEAMGMVFRAGRALNGFFSKVYTGYNPEFIFTNILRDFTTGLANVTGEEGIAMAAKSAKNYAGRFLELAKYAATGNETKWVKMYREDGGNTGAAYLSDLERLGADLQTEYAAYQGVMKNLAEGNYLTAARAAGRKTVGKLLNVIEVINMAGENAMRLAVYQSMVESGKSRAEAASMAKNVTVNFNRKGTMGAHANAVFLFFNAGVQGTASMAHAHFKGKHKYQAWAFSSSLAGIGYLLSLMAAADDEDDYEKTSEFDRSRNMLIKTENGYVKIPVPYGYGFFWNLGRGLADAQRTGEIGKMPWHVAASFVEEFTPFGAVVAGREPDGAQAFHGALPTALQIPHGILYNKTSFGTPMRPESGFDRNQPDRDKMNRPTRGTIADDLAGALESAGMDVSPETLKYLWRTFTGGAGTTATSVFDAAKLKAQGAELDVKEMPFVRKVYTETDVRGARARYYEAKDEADKALAEFKRATKKGDTERADRVEKESEGLIEMSRLANAMNKEIKAARDRIDSVRLSGEYTKAEERMIIKQMEKEEAELYDDFMAQFKERTRK